MRGMSLARVGTWVLRHLPPHRYLEALSGDLLEEFASGQRTAGWYCRQVMAAVGLTLLRSSRGYGFPLAFSAVWSLLYPAWQQLLWTGWMEGSVDARWWALDWPYSALLEIGSGMLPALLFLWLGFAVYVALRAGLVSDPGWGRRNEFSWGRVPASFSFSLSVLLVATLAVFGLAGGSREDHSQVLGHAIFFLAPYRPVLSLPLGLSLLASILSARTPAEARTLPAR